MARFHWFGFIVNEAGEPIENAEVSIHLAGSDYPAHVYRNEYSDLESDVVPQMTTLSNGYYEFWIGDYTEDFGYPSTQKFKIKWERIGIASGEIDFVNIFPLTQGFSPVDETDENSIVKDKVVSNNLAWQWTTHVNHDVNEDGLVHGFLELDVTNDNGTYNRILSNLDGWTWDQHRISTPQNFLVSQGTPHGIEEVDYGNEDTEVNKLVSNKIIHDLVLNHGNLVIQSEEGDANLLALIEALTLVVESNKSDVFEILELQWTDNLDGSFEYTIPHMFAAMYPTVICWDHATNLVEKMAEIELIDVNNVKITIYGERMRLNVRVTN